MSYSPPPPPQYSSQPSRGVTAIPALICSIIMIPCCNPLCGIIALVFSALAMGKPPGPEQDQFLRYAWNTMGIGLALSVISGLVYLAFLGSI